MALGNPLTWIADTFNSDASDTDVVKSRALNSTRIAAVVSPVLVGIWTALSELADKPPFNDTNFQEKLILVMVGFVAVVVAADTIARAVASVRQQAMTANNFELFAESKKATKREAGTDTPGNVIARRMIGNGLEYLFVADGGTTEWLLESDTAISS